MARGFTVQETSNRPLEEVWSFLIDMRNARKWMPGVEHMKPITPGPIDLGSRFAFSTRGAEREAEVSAWEPNAKIALTSTHGSVKATYEYSVERQGESTQVRLNAVCEAKGFSALAHPFIGRAMKKRDGGHLIQLKTAIEIANS